MRILIVDDEMPARKQLRALINEFKKSEAIVIEAKSGEEALNLLNDGGFDVVFLDIHLQDMTGLEIAEEMVARKHHSKIVFVTAYDQYALKAFDYAAVDYLLKPIEDLRFEKTLKRLEKEWSSDRKKEMKSPLSTVEQLLKEHLKEEHQPKKITLERDDRLYVVDMKEIIYIETEDRCTKVVTEKGDFLSNLTLTEWEEKLWYPPFFRTHRSYFVNLEKIQEVIFWFNNSLQIKMAENPDNLIPVSRSKTRSFKERMHIQN